MRPIREKDKGLWQFFDSHYYDVVPPRSIKYKITARKIENVLKSEVDWVTQAISFADELEQLLGGDVTHSWDALALNEKALDALRGIRSAILVFQSCYRIARDAGIDTRPIFDRYDRREPMYISCVQRIESLVSAISPSLMKTDGEVWKLAQEIKSNSPIHTIHDFEYDQRIRDAKIQVMSMIGSVGSKANSIVDSISNLFDRSAMPVTLKPASSGVAFQIHNNRTGTDLKLERSFVAGLVDGAEDLPGLISTSEVVEALFQLRRQDRFKELPAISDERLLSFCDFIMDHFDADEGYFVSRSSQRSSNGPVDTRSALSAIDRCQRMHRINQDVEDSDSFLDEVFCRSGYEREEFARALSEMLTKQLNSCLDNQQIAQRNGSYRPSTIIDLYHVIASFRLAEKLFMRSPNLFWGRGFLGREYFDSAKRIHRYVISCFHDSKGGEFRDEDYGGASLSPLPGSEEICLTAVYFAVSLLRAIGWSRYEVQKFVNPRTVAFVADCWDENKGGYGFRPGEPAELVHTLLALRMHRRFDLVPDAKQIGDADDIVRRRQLEIMSFVSSCRKNGGYAILPEWWPGASGTRLALLINNELDRSAEDIHSISGFLESLIVSVGGKLGANGYQRIPIVERRSNLWDFDFNL